MGTTYLYLDDETKIDAQVIDCATSEVTITPRFGAPVCITLPTGTEAQRFAIRLSDALWLAEKRGPGPLSEQAVADDVLDELDEARADALEAAMAYAHEDAF